MQESTYVSPEEAARAFSLQPETIRRLCRDGKIPGARKIGGVWRIPKSFLSSDVGSVQQMAQDEDKK